jgi:hypothetical protein
MRQVNSCGGMTFMELLELQEGIDNELGRRAVAELRHVNPYLSFIFYFLMRR